MLPLVMGVARLRLEHAWPVSVGGSHDDDDDDPVDDGRKCKVWIITELESIFQKQPNKRESII